MDPSKLTCKNIVGKCSEMGVKAPSHLNKAELVLFYQQLVYAKKDNLSTEMSSNYKLPMKEFKSRLISKYSEGDWYDHLIEYGWATVEIPHFDVDAATNGFYTTLETCSYKNSKEPTKFRRDDPGTWSELPPNIHGIFKSNFGHFDWQWEIRDKCRPIFQDLCQDKEVVTSFDGACFIPPGRGMNGSWFHCDQPRSEPDFCCVQGVVALTPSGPNDGGLCVIERSHNIFTQYCDKYPLYGFSWGKVNLEDSLISNLPLIKVCAPAGHIMLFDSRTFHCNTPPEKDSKCPRMVSYVSMLAKRQGSDVELKKRQKAFDELRMTNHWSVGSWMWIMPKESRTYGVDYLVPIETLPKLSEDQRAMIA